MCQIRSTTVVTRRALREYGTDEGVKARSWRVRRVNTAVERIWHINGSQGQILALALSESALNRLNCSLVARKRLVRPPQIRRVAITKVNSMNLQGN